MSGVDVINFGCRLNIAEGEAIRDAAHAEDDLIIINSCAVTAEAERQARQAIRKAARLRPNARIMVTGCAAETRPEIFAAMPEVTGLVSNRTKGLPGAFSPSGPLASALIRPAISGADHARAFIEVQNGCDHDCTFCIIPKGRGESRSIPAGGVIEAVQQAVERGQQEVILTGVDLASYGPDLPGSQTLGHLVERILKYVPTLHRLRLSSLDAPEVDDRLFDLLTSEPRMMPHIHLSLQHGDDLMLKRMKRRHARADAVRLVERLKAKRPEIAIGADIIAGFPTETAAMFAQSLSLLEACDVVYGHIFPFSPREGTPAARMPQLDRVLIKSRAETLRIAAQARQRLWLEQHIGTVQRVLVENDGITGHAPDFARVRLADGPASGNMRGMMMDIRITALTSDILEGVRA